MKKRVIRKVRRFPARLALLELNGEPMENAFLVDISSLGAQLECPRPLALKSPVELVVRFPHHKDNTRLSGLVCWVKPLLGHPRRFRLGVKFYRTFWELDQMARQDFL